MLDNIKNKAHTILSKVRPAKKEAAVPDDLTSVPTGIQIRGDVSVFRYKKTAMYVAIASVLGVVIYSLVTSPEAPDRKQGGAAPLKAEKMANSANAFYKDEPDFWFEPKMPEPEPVLSNGAKMPPPPAAPGSFRAPAGGPDAPPPLLASNGGSVNATPRVDLRTTRAPMVAWQAGMPVTGAGIQGQATMGQLAAAQQAAAGTVPMPRALSPVQGSPLSPVVGQGMQQVAALTPSASTGAYGQGVMPVSAYEVKAGWVIPGVLIESINSDSSDMVRAQVAENVYDTKTGKYLLIPAGTRLIGTYGAQPAWGQDRLQVAWTRMIFPDTTEYDISGMNGSDATGAAGFSDRVNNHYGRLLTTAMLMSVFGVQAQVAGQQNTATANGSVDVGNAMAASTAQQINNTAQTLLQRDARVAPTIEIRAGYRFNVKVNKTVIFNRSYPLTVAQR